MPNTKKYSELTAEQKAKWYGQSRNERRRAAYAANRDHRKEVQTRNRESYLNKFGAKRTGITLSEKEAPMLSYSKTAPIVEIISPTKALYTKKVVDTNSLVKILGLGSATRLYRMQARGMFPRPVYEVTGEYIPFQSKKVFLFDELLAIMPVWVGHYSSKSLYREDHVETRTKLFAAVERVRITNP